MFPFILSFHHQIVYRNVKNLQIGIDKLVCRKGADKFITLPESKPLA